jgi:hypothetical protein
MQLAIVDHGHMLATHGVRNQPVAGKPKLAMARCWVADCGSAGWWARTRGGVMVKILEKLVISQQFNQVSAT